MAAASYSASCKMAVHAVHFAELTPSETRRPTSRVTQSAAESRLWFAQHERCSRAVPCRLPCASSGEPRGAVSVARGGGGCLSREVAVTFPKQSSVLSRAGRRRPVAVQCLQSASLAPGVVHKVTAEQLDALLLSKRTVPLIIDFYATWCGPCLLLAQELDRLALEYGAKAQFVKVDTDQEEKLACQLEIRGLPTIVFVSEDNTKNAVRAEGLLPALEIRRIIDEEL